ncbi:MAG: hypothetical protein LBI87_08485 [Candidatus Accumulibacter sp.]|jgi:hypothetical protein|nr:hypothetical protein [Accumulibacter sp.]
MRINGPRGLLAEYGEAMSAGRKGLDKMPEILARLSESLPAVSIDGFRDRLAMIGRLDERILVIERLVSPDGSPPVPQGRGGVGGVPRPEILMGRNGRNEPERPGHSFGRKRIQ